MDVQSVHLHETPGLGEGMEPEILPCNWPHATSARRNRHLFLIPTKAPYELTISSDELDFELVACGVFVI